MVVLLYEENYFVDRKLSRNVKIMYGELVCYSGMWQDES